MNPDDQLDILQKIKTVDAPPFLLTRIKERIRGMEDAPVSKRWKWAFAVTGFIILFLNTTILIKTAGRPDDNQLDNLVSTLHLSSQNSLYDE